MTLNQTGGTQTSGWAARIAAAVLCLGVTAIHIIDQGGIPGSKTPVYVGIGYYVLEIIGVITAVLLLTRASQLGWFLAIGVAAGPLIGYILSRGPGLPDYDDDKGNWTEPLGLISLVVEGVLLILAIALFLRTARVGSAATGSAKPSASRIEA
jgi:hypothetical protein